MADQQRIVIFRGNVQGVGFRYTACRIAENYAIAGHVRNLPDGTVEVLAEGPPLEIDRFLAELTEQFGGYIKSQTRQTAPPSGQYHSFGVRR